MLLSTLLLAAALALPSADNPTAAPVPTPQFRRYGVNEGLPSSNVYTLVQDHQGFIWIGTRSGLARFDGVNFKVFRHNPLDPASLPGDDISSVLVDHRDRVWVGGEASGINLLDPATGTFQHWLHVQGDPDSLAGNDLLALAQDSKGTIWAGLYRAGLDRMTADGKFVHLRHVAGDPTSLSSDTVVSLHPDAHGRLWIGTAEGLDLRDADGSLHHVRFEGLTKPPRVWSIDGEGSQVRAATSAGLFAVDASLVASRIAPDFLPHHTVLSSLRDRDGSLWVGGLDGLYWVGRDHRHRAFPKMLLLPGGQPGSLIWQIRKDREGGLWLATQDGGVGYLSPDWPDFTRFTHVPDDADSLSGSRTIALARDAQGNLLVGGETGQLDRLNPTSGEVTHLGKRLGLPAIAVRSLATTASGKIWVGLHAGLDLVDGNRLRPVADARFSDGVRRMAVDPYGRAYASPPGGGMLRVDPETLAVTEVGLAQSVEADRETKHLLWHDGTLWRGSNAGMSRLSAERPTLRRRVGHSPRGGQHVHLGRRRSLGGASRCTGALPGGKRQRAACRPGRCQTPLARAGGAGDHGRRARSRVDAQRSGAVAIRSGQWQIPPVRRGGRLAERRVQQPQLGAADRWHRLCRHPGWGGRIPPRHPARSPAKAAAGGDPRQYPARWQDRGAAFPARSDRAAMA